MTLNDVQRAALALFAARAAGTGASLEQMKAIALCIRKRVWDGWHDGSWLSVIEHADEVMANKPGPPVYLDVNSRILQRFIADIDDLYYSIQSRQKAPTHQSKTAQQSATEGDFSSVGDCCYWMFLNQPIRPWFQEHILNDPEHHAHKAQMGLMLFIE
jgi:hypothetical protein